mmetsp:Transcript_15247/g.32267  ORF Transcript_15247/g.32267 Transcript_15247/m.32267 type:complete len:392 (-) Transcript_15247:125-1300(-)
MNIADLPDNLLVDVAAFLAKPSRALFAVALTAPSSSWCASNLERRRPSTSANVLIAAASSIVGGNCSRDEGRVGTDDWSVLDFGKIDNGLASKLADDDISAVLTCIDAIRNLKSLKLGGCVNITGYGLEPLRSSIVLEQLDLSLAGRNERPLIEPKPRLSEMETLPIISSIIHQDGNSLRQLQLPIKFRTDQSVSLSLLLSEYNHLLLDRRPPCSKCGQLILVDDDEVWDHWVIHSHEEGADQYGYQLYTCYGCLKHFCNDCTDENGTYYLGYCTLCERAYCAECNDTRSLCNWCEGPMCEGCGDLVECKNCRAFFCENCLHTCEGCNAIRCRDCIMYTCESNCNNAICRDCFRDNPVMDYCGDCNLLVVPSVVTLSVAKIGIAHARHAWK